MSAAPMTFRDYRAIEAVNWSKLKHLRESPLKYQHSLTEPDVDSTARALGRATHTLVFEPQLFEEEFAIWTEGDRRGKEWLAFKAAHESKTILKSNEVEVAAAMANAVRVHPLAAPYLSGGKFEHVAVWDDPTTGIKCKAKMDWTVESTASLIDLKTSNTIDQFRFGRIAARLGYHCQMSHYFSGCHYGLGWTPKKTAIVAVESAAPYDVAVFVLDEETLFVAQEEVRKLLEQLKALREADAWPGRYTSEQPLLLPPWIYGEDDEDAESLGVNFN